MKRPAEGFNPIIMIIATVSAVVFYLIKDGLNIPLTGNLILAILIWLSSYQLLYFAFGEDADLFLIEGLFYTFIFSAWDFWHPLSEQLLKIGFGKVTIEMAVVIALVKLVQMYFEELLGTVILIAFITFELIMIKIFGRSLSNVYQAINYIDMIVIALVASANYQVYFWRLGRNFIDG
jgi:hypothetical protein